MAPPLQPANSHLKATKAATTAATRAATRPGGTRAAARIDWRAKLRHFVQVVAFALAIAGIQYAFTPQRPLGPPMVYSLLIATITWAIIDLGRELFPSSAQTGWPPGLQGLGLVVTGIVVGYLAGTALAEALCVHVFRFYAAGAHTAALDVRSSLIISALAGIAGTYYFYTINQAAYLQRQTAQALHQASQARLKLLESQLEPHMLFNTLANLRALIGTDPPAAQRMLDRINDYLRATLAASRATEHPLRAEFERLRDYLELMQVRMGERLAFTLDLPEDLATHPVPALLLQPLVENAIKHGLEPKIQGGHISVSARREGASLVLVVHDTGVGPPPETSAAPDAAHDAGASTADAQAGVSDGSGGFGLAQVRERLATAYGEQGVRARRADELFQWGPAEGGGTRCRITIPLQP